MAMNIKKEPVEEMSSPLLAQIMENCKSERLLSITKTHISTLLKYSDAVAKKRSAAFSSKEEYHEFAVAKFYIDKCIGALKIDAPEVVPEVHIEEGEIRDDESDQPVTEAEQLPPLESFHLSPSEKKKRLYNFWKNVREGEIYHAKVVGITDLVYELVIINKYLNDERLIDISINAYMKKSSCKENLDISDLVRAYVHSYTTAPSDTFHLILSADSAEIKVKIEVSKLGKILKEELPFPPIEACKFNSLAQYVAAHCNDRNTDVLINRIKSLEIDPYKTYSLLPDLDGKKSIKPKEDTETSTPELKAVKTIKEALFWKEKKDVLRALSCANTALDHVPNYDYGLAVRGTLYEMKADGKPGQLMKLAIQDYIRALQINDRCTLALKRVSDLLLRSAYLYLEEGNFKKTREKLEHSQLLQRNKFAEELMREVDIYEKKYADALEENERSSSVEEIPMTI